MEAASKTVRVRLLNKKNEVLLVLEKAGKIITKTDGTSFPKPAGWGLPGGRVRSDETPLEAAIRELREEVNLTAAIASEPVEIVRSEDGRHEIWLFAAEDPEGEIATTETYIIAARWIDWKLAYGTLKFQNQEYAIYQSHMRMIHLAP